MMGYAKIRIRAAVSNVATRLSLFKLMYFVIENFVQCNNCGTQRKLAWIFFSYWPKCDHTLLKNVEIGTFVDLGFDTSVRASFPLSLYP
jgi:hypothetical protein